MAGFVEAVADAGEAVARATAATAVAERRLAEVEALQVDLLGEGGMRSKLRRLAGTDSASVDEALREIECRLESLSRTARGNGVARAMLAVLSQYRCAGA